MSQTAKPSERALADHDAVDGGDPTHSFQRLREAVLHTLLRALSWGALPISIVLLLQARNGNFLTLAVVGFAVVAQTLIGLRLSARRLGYRRTALSLLTILLVLATYSQIFRGLTPGAALLQVAAILLAALLFGRRGALRTLAACLVTLGLGGVLVTSGLVSTWDPEFWNPHAPVVWLRYAMVLVVLAGPLALVFVRMISHLEGQVQSLHTALLAERAERARRERVQSALERAQRLETLAQLSGGIAHDLNNSLSIVMGSAELLRANPESSPAVTSLVDGILDAATTSVATVRQLLTLGRRDDVKPQQVGVHECLRRLSAGLHELLPAAISLRIETATAAEIVVDLARFQQAILNLIINARDAMPEGGELLITCAQVSVARVPEGWAAEPGSFVQIAIRDTGVGMDESTQQHIFEPFFTTKEVGAGTGLGLAMVHAVVHDAGGYIELDSVPQRGTTMRLAFPTAERASAALAERRERPTGVSPAS